MNGAVSARTAGRVTLLIAALASTGALAVETRIVQETASTLLRGESDGIAVTRRGRLFLAPRMTALGSTIGAPPYAWSIAADSAGNLFVGTGPGGQILKVTPSGRRSLFFTADEPMVTALAFAPDGTLLAGTAPSGRIYRIAPDGSGEAWSETGERYVWSLLAMDDGRVFAGTGENGVILEIDREGAPRLFFDTDESHVVKLVAGPRGVLLAGGAGRGLVYQVDEEGHGLVLHDDDLPEVTGIAVLDDGALAVSLLASPETEPRPPAVRIRLPGQEQPAGGGAESVGDLEGGEGPTLEGVIEGLPLRGEGEEPRLRGRVIRIEQDGGATEIWRSTTEAPYCLAVDGGGRVVFGSGEPGRVYRVEQDGDLALLGSLREAQVSTLYTADGWIAVATSNPSGVYRLEPQGPETGVFLSHPIDAGSPARWGSLAWTLSGDPGRVDFFTRTGNSAVPDDTWSAWSPALTVGDGSPIVNPDGRFLQWRVKFDRERGAGTAIASVRVTYAPVNRPPEISDFRYGSAELAARGPARFRWRARDPDGDPLVVTLEYRARDEREWRTATATDPRTANAEQWRDDEANWDTSGVAEGGYEVRARVSDDVANHPGDGRYALAEPTAFLIVDRTPPRVVSQRRDAGTLEIEVTDERAGVRRLELVREGQTRFTARPVDGVCDSPSELFRIDAAVLRGEGWILRAVDAAGNSVETPLSPS